MLTFQLNFVSEAYTESWEVFLKRNVYDFSVNHNAIVKSDITNIHNYLMVKNNIKQCLGLLNKCLLEHYVLADL